MKYNFKSVQLFIGFLTLMLSNLSNTFAQIVYPIPECYNFVGSIGVVDEIDREFVLLGIPEPPAFFQFPWITPPIVSTNLDGAIGLKPNAPKGVYNTRYNVTPFTIYPTQSLLEFNIRYLVRDTSKHRVIAVLKEYDIFQPNYNEKSRIISKFDSDKSTPSSKFQTQKGFLTVNNFDWNFRSKAYYVEVLLIKKQSSTFHPFLGTDGPAVAGISICHQVVIDGIDNDKKTKGINNLRDSIASQNSKIDFTIYPNPTNDNLIIRFNNLLDNNIKLLIVDNLGKSIFEKKVKIKESSLSLDVSQFHSGIYTLSIKSLKGNHIGTKQFVVAR